MATILTTGVILKNAETSSVHVDIVNLNSEHTRNVTVEIFNWTTCPPVPVGLLARLCETQIAIDVNKIQQKLEPNQFLEVETMLLSGVMHYEVRVTLSKEKDVVVNSWGEHAGITGRELKEGNTVLHKDFVRLK